ncbi:DUF1573 domain-containing protein [Salibacter sp.]|uniref:DUF1573 domain-containing protein n=1 Tax=Salibacter sp. TaxID=2010995 RepID=UPI00287078C0|nr:DUF1573 domain-containing protein [Salibacter sp.]MDR9398509.1 DUF1573 domain-containing protein [Salibacter sp.]MDR9486443.1 DUF1573 domain-containing protein [Salibacter sp.]
MKKLLLSLSLVLFAGATLFAQEVGGPEIEFEKNVHDFGKMKQYGDASTEFKFTNTGSEPLIISNARGSCGCTVPSWPREPIAPGESAVINVKYDSKRIGPINKSVTITSNAVNQPTKVIRIKGHIDPAPKEETMPVNKSDGAPVSK